MERNIQLHWQSFVEEAINRRKGQKLTQRELAVLVGVSRPTLIRFEQGDTNLSIANALKILDALGLVSTGGESRDYSLFPTGDESKDYSSFSISYQGNVYEEGFKKSDIGYFTVKLLDEKGLIDDKVFKLLRKDKSSSLRLIKSLEEMTKVEMRYSKYRFNKKPELIYNDKGYYVVRNWGIANIGIFMNKITTKFPEIEFIRLKE